MLLYHYTSLLGLQKIRASGFLKCSAKTLLSPPWVPLTIDTLPLGHGVPDGREIGAEEACQILHLRRDGKMYCADQTECRIVMDLPNNDPDLIHAAQYHSPTELLALEILGWNPVWDTMPPAIIRQTRFLLENHCLPRKASTWWYYKKPISLQLMVRFEKRTLPDTFVAMY